MKYQWIYLVWVLTVAACSHAGPDKTAWVVTSGAHLRQKPTAQGASLRVLATDEAVSILAASPTRDTQPLATGQVSDVWYQVRDKNGTEGWVFGGCLAKISHQVLQKTVWIGSDMRKASDKDCPYPVETDCDLTTLVFLPGNRVYASFFCEGNDEDCYAGTYSLHDSTILVQFNGLSVGLPMAEAGEKAYTQWRPLPPLTIDIRTCRQGEKMFLYIADKNIMLDEPTVGANDQTPNAFMNRLRHAGVVELLSQRE